MPRETRPSPGLPLIRFLFGRTRAARRRALADLGVLRVDALGVPRFLYLTGTRALAEQVRRELRDDAALPPEILTLEEAYRALWRHLGDGRPILGESALAMYAWRLLAAEGWRWPALGEHADAALALARLDQQLDAEGARPRHPAMVGAVEALRAAVGRSEGGVRRTVALRRLILALSSGARGPWSPEAVIVDDPCGLTPIEAALLTALCRSWSAAGAEVVVTTSSGRDLGGAEVMSLLGIDPPEDRRADRALLAASAVRGIALELVATGEAEVGVSGPGGWSIVEPWSEPGPLSPPDLADIWAEGGRVPVADPAGARRFAGRVRVLSPIDRAAEAREVARAVADLLRSGVDPDDCLVAATDPEGYAGPLSAALADHGVPHRIRGAGTLAALPLVRAIRLAAGQALDGYSPDGLCSLADLLGIAPGGLSPRALRRWCAAAGVRSGSPLHWSRELVPWAKRTRTARAEPLSEALERMEALASALAPLAEERAPEDWRRTLIRVLDEIGLTARATAVEGGLSALAAVEALTRSLVRDLAAAEPGPWPATDLRTALERALAAAEAPDEAPVLAAVPVVPLWTITGLTPPHTFVVGLDRRSFRAPFEGRPLAHGEAPPPDPGIETRYVLGALLREVLAEDGDVRALWLSWPATGAGATLAPAAVLGALLDLPTEDPERRLGALLVERPDPDPGPGRPASRSELLWAATLEAEVGGPSLERLAPGQREAVLRQIRVFRERTGEIGPRDGIVGAGATSGPGPNVPPSVSVTAMDTYLSCPARYWYVHLLGLAPPDPSAHELEPRRRGTALHRILERFLLLRGLVPPSEDRDPLVARRGLHTIATEVLDAVEAEGGFDPLFQQYARQRWLAGLLDDRPAGVLRAWLDAERAATDVVPEAVERAFEGLRVGPIEVHGIIDRIDRLHNGARLVTDYKTGVPPPQAHVRAAIAFQPIAYAAWVALSTGAPVAAAYLSLAKPDAIRRTALSGDPEALDAAASGEERRRALVLDPPRREALLHKVALAAEDLVSGRFPPSPHPPEVAGCRVCPFRRVCRRDDERHATKTEDPG